MNTTFDEIQRTWGTVDAAHVPDETVRLVAAPTTLSRLPTLPIGEPGEEPAPDLELRDVLGEGGMGIVHLARQASLGRDVAVKRPRHGGPASGGLLREARYMGSLEHPNIIPVHALGRDDAGRPLLVMKRVEGVPWRDLIRDPGHPSWALRDTAWSADPVARHVELLAEVCQAMAYAHRRGVVHRDLKPDNTMVGDHGEVYVLDWGIAIDAGATTSAPAGTPAYMAPEMLDPAAPADPRVDVFLLGACLFEALHGRPPHGGSTLSETLRAAHHGEVVFTEGPVTLRRIGAAACARDPSDRPPDAAALLSRLTAWLRHRGSERVAEAAAERLEALRALDDPAAAEAAFAEARFGFRQALDAWSDNPAAQAGLVEALQRIGRHRISRGDAAGAELAASELEALGASAGDLRDAAGAERERAERLSALERDLDLSVGETTRNVVGLTILAVTLAIGVAVALGMRSGSLRFGPDRAALIGLGFYGVIALCLLIGRRAFFANAANRRLALLVAIASPLTVVNRGLVWWMGGTVAPMLASDLLLLSAVGIAISLYSLRWFWPFAVACLGSALGVALQPELAAEIFTGGLLVGFAGCLPARWAHRAADEPR